MKHTRIDRVGETKLSHQGFLMTIIKYESSKKIVIQFNDKYNTTKIDEYIDFKKGHVENPSVVCMHHKGVAYKQDVQLNPIAFNKWRAMFDRCYGVQTGNNAVYKGCQVCEEWQQFENFVSWFNQNYYVIDNEQMDLDKDIIGSGKIYSPQTCIFVPHKLNSQFATRHHNKHKKELPIGVTYHKRQNGTVCYRVVALPKNQLFDKLEDAEKAYYNYVKQQYHEFATQYKNQIPQVLYQKLMNF